MSTARERPPASVDPRLLDLLSEAQRRGASDLLISTDAPPHVYVNASLDPMDQPPLRADDVHALTAGLMDEPTRRRLNERRDVDFAIGHAAFGRCRVNVHYQRGTLAAAFRFVPARVPDFDTLHLPDVLKGCTRLPRGLVLVTGGTGSGKSTTLAAMIQRINRDAAVHVITLEDPIEYVFTNERSLIEQREIGADSPSFPEALRHVVRQKPDVIMIGELRDLETVRAALTAAEMGHLVLASLHTINAAHTVARIVDIFEPAQQPQIRVQLAGALRAIACQNLFRTADGAGMVPAVEILINTPAIARAIRDGETHLIQGMVETGANRGMRSMDSAIAELLDAGRIAREDAVSAAIDPERMEKLLDRILVGTGQGARPWE